MLIYAQSHSHSHTNTDGDTHKPSKGLLNISQREEAHTWNLDTLFGHYGRGERPTLTVIGLEIICLEREESLTLKCMTAEIFTVQRVSLFMLALHTFDIWAHGLLQGEFIVLQTQPGW